MKGVYVIHIPEMEADVYKIGCSKDIARRMTLFNTTTRLTPIELVYQKEFEYYTVAETSIHKLLDKYRMRQDREFFKCDLQTIIDTIDNTTDQAPEVKERKKPVRARLIRIYDLEKLGLCPSNKEEVTYNTECDALKIELEQLNELEVKAKAKELRIKIIDMKNQLMDEINKLNDMLYDIEKALQILDDYKTNNLYLLNYT